MAVVLPLPIGWGEGRGEGHNREYPPSHRALLDRIKLVFVSHPILYAFPLTLNPSPLPKQGAREAVLPACLRFVAPPKTAENLFYFVRCFFADRSVS